MVSVILTFCASVGVLESVTIKVIGALDSVTVGGPEIAPEEEFSDNPAGRVPAVMDQVYGALPPCADSVAE